METENTENTEVLEVFGNCFDCSCELATIDDSYTNDYSDEHRCETCNDDYVAERENEDDQDECYDLPSRDFSRNLCKSYSMLNNKTKILKSQRAIGIELECQGHSFDDIQSIYDELDERIGMSGDGSISGNKGFELQFPLGNGRIIEKMLEKSCEILNNHNTKVDKSCGYHVHLESLPDERGYDFIQRTMFFSAIFEDVIFSFLPKSRQENNYCRKIKNFIKIDQILSCNSMDDLEYIWYKTYDKRSLQDRKRHKYDNSRYCGFNFHCYIGSGKHLEIRHHNGTTNYKKILTWANLHCLILDYIRKEVKRESNIHNWDMKRPLIKMFDSVYNKKQTLEEKTQFFFDLIGLDTESRKYFINRQKNNQN